MLMLRVKAGGKTIEFGAQQGRLVLLSSVHVGDLGMTGLTRFLDWIREKPIFRYGEAMSDNGSSRPQIIR